MLHETRKQFIEPRGHDSSNNKASATPRFRRRRERGVATRERGGLTRKMERKYRDEGWHNPSDAPPIDYPVVYLLLPFASVAFLVALMKGPSVIVLISLFRFHLSLSSSFSLSFDQSLPPHQTLQIRTRKQNRKAHRCADPCTNVRTCKQPSCSFPFENQ